MHIQVAAMLLCCRMKWMGYILFSGFSFYCSIIFILEKVQLERPFGSCISIHNYKISDNESIWVVFFLLHLDTSVTHFYEFLAFLSIPWWWVFFPSILIRSPLLFVSNSLWFVSNYLNSYEKKYKVQLLIFSFRV